MKKVSRTSSAHASVWRRLRDLLLLRSYPTLGSPEVLQNAPDISLFCRLLEEESSRLSSLKTSRASGDLAQSSDHDQPSWRI